MFNPLLHPRFHLTAILLISLFSAAFAADEDDPRLSALTTDPNGAKISTTLLRLEHKQQVLGPRVYLQPEVKALAKTKRGLVVDVILGTANSAAITKLNGTGTTVLKPHPNMNCATVEVTDLTALHRLAALPEVEMIKPAFGARTRTNNGDHSGVANGRARRALNADELVTTQGITGLGQTVGIISDSFAVTADVRDDNTLPAFGQSGVLTGAINQDSGDLPTTVALLEDDPTGFDEGSAMGEIVHDIAPGASIAFHAAGATEADFADGINKLRTQAHATVLVDDIGFLDEPFYQTGRASQAEINAIHAGVPYFSAAGNDENRCLRQPYKDVMGAHDPNVDKKPVRFTHLHDWGGGNAFLPVTVGPNDYAIAILQWNQPSQSLNKKAGSQVDFDLYVVDTPDTASLPTATNVSTIIQGKTKKGKGDAWEGVEIDNFDFVSSQTFYVVVDHVQGNFDTIPQNNLTPLEITMMFPFSGDIAVAGINDRSSNYGGPTIFGHVQARGVVSVAAAPWWESPLFDPTLEGTLDIDPEYYSSRGGLQTVFFNRLGQFSPVTDFSPSITGVDGESTTFFYSDDSGLPGFLTGYEGEPDGFPNFFGTSAAAPSAAAVAALLKEVIPSLSSNDFKTILAASATDITGERCTPGVDDVTNAGLINAAAARDQLNTLPNLEPVAANGLSDPLVLSSTTGATTDGELHRKLGILASFSVQNTGAVTIPGGFDYSITIDGIVASSGFIVGSLAPGAITTQSNIALTIPKLKGVNHVFVLTVDSTDTIVELSNDDNIVTKIVPVLK